MLHGLPRKIRTAFLLQTLLAGLAGLLAMPFGFDSIFWRTMDFGIQWMILVAQWVESLPGSVGRVPAFGSAQPPSAASARWVISSTLPVP